MGYIGMCRGIGYVFRFSVLEWKSGKIYMVAFEQKKPEMYILNYKCVPLCVAGVEFW